jgi:hypothetical protein
MTRDWWNLRMAAGTIAISYLSFWIAVWILKYHYSWWRIGLSAYGVTQGIIFGTIGYLFVAFFVEGNRTV